jgi:hypothetical protein
VIVHDVVAAAPRDKRDAAIRAWSRSVWEAYSREHGAVRAWNDGALS